jgi:carboxypeptidase T
MHGAEPSHPTRKRLGWAKLMARVFGIDVLACPRCKSKLQVPAAVLATISSMLRLICVVHPWETVSMMHRSIYYFVCVLTLLNAQAFAEVKILSDNPASATYQDVKGFMRQLASQFPTTTRIFTLGRSDSGDDIEGLEIGFGPTHNLVVATHHGNEYGATEVARAFAASVAQNPIPGQTVYVIPVLNIGGYNMKRREESSNGRSYDPNRDYPGPCGTEGPHRLRDTSALAAFIASNNIISSATLHTYYPAVVYPWGMATQDLSTPYNDLFEQLVSLATVESQYATGNSSEVIYPASGTFEDYAFWKHGVWSLLFELGHRHLPSLTDIETMVKLNIPGLRRMLEQAPTQRAEKHEFTGKCDERLWTLDRHDE